MLHVMFDIDGTLVQSTGFDGDCFVAAVDEVLGHRLDDDWAKYTHVTDAGILDQHIDYHGLHKKREIIHADVKSVFTDNISKRLNDNAVQPVAGAADFIAELRRHNSVSLSIATGGWQETALMKLESAGIDVMDIPIASSNDHYSRTEIMKIAEQRAIGKFKAPCTYFGDGEWDKNACEELGFNFVLVGEGTFHHQRIADYRKMNQVMTCIGL